MIPTECRFEYVKKVARNLLIDEELGTFPINAFEIAPQFGVEFIPYGQLDHPLPKKLLDGMIISYDGRLVIAYNDKITCKKRMNWTIMHELGHLFLHHLKYSNTKWLTDLSETERRVLEVEANFFAGEVLAPYAITKQFHRVPDSKTLEKLFGLSKRAAKKRIKTLRSYHLYEKAHIEQDQQIYSHYSDSLELISVCSNRLDASGFDTFNREGLSSSSLSYPFFKPFPTPSVSDCIEAAYSEDTYFCPNCGRSTHLIPKSLFIQWKIHMYARSILSHCS
ncbi:ImmA/IrrE family metallo-endopeptidase [Thermoactinomyces sp. DSM 45892]|uniref:ImmA/IrrE family metallo-endopeptidase n=1 Tax=Thermoactinomyces sp. DSM 45892 TaxID=1882753 RepID=UPI000895C088|nr:ImmA/IrrE family metallo-endopeptidase [Thermoactinomyces sp. DSM 45892]SDY22178.1 protein of unknown function [Thermoactinomyces sp. DSM 45892]